MNSFRQHIPSGVDISGTPQEYQFETTEELLRLEVVLRFSQDSNFSHFAKSDNCLMAISDGGSSWWVVGFIADPASVNLPQWDRGRHG